MSRQKHGQVRHPALALCALQSCEARSHLQPARQTGAHADATKIIRDMTQVLERLKASRQLEEEFCGPVGMHSCTPNQGWAMAPAHATSHNSQAASVASWLTVPRMLGPIPPVFSKSNTYHGFDQKAGNSHRENSCISHCTASVSDRAASLRHCLPTFVQRLTPTNSTEVFLLLSRPSTAGEVSNHR